ncbi:hypothetical protein B0J11DRAFT_599958 [Dendryphion nanum]|uniref:Uncharacterized protein n=1 Tax=Dendryphion nanum TaxID=256645 RepID=A0A9P9E700_9PLEO|nr:hypothetical protein B0J11DRAFT_599958 [Dendryphion nanum]
MHLMMGMKTLVLGLLSGGHIFWVQVQALAQQPEIIPYPLTNATTSTPTSTISTCENKCSVYYPRITAVSWVPRAQIVYTEKVTIATVEIIINATQNTTFAPSTRTIWRPDVTSKYKNSLFFQNTDAQGTQVITIPVPDPKWGTLFSPFAYPTGYVDYASTYTWQGILSTKKSSTPICATATLIPSTALLPKHPNYPQPSQVPAIDLEDPFGQEHVPLRVTLDLQPDKSFFTAAFPTETAFQICSSIPHPIPIQTIYSIPKFITETTTIFSLIRSPAIGKIETSVTGFETTNSGYPVSTTSSPPVAEIPRIQSSASGFEDLDPGMTPQGPAGVKTTAGAGRPQVQETREEDLREPVNTAVRDWNSVVVTAVGGGAVGTGGGVAPTPTPAPIFTLLPTTINGVWTTVPAYIIPVNPSSTLTATIGQTVTVNGMETVVVAPSLYYTSVSTTVSGTPTIVPVVVIDGTRTVGLGQTVVVGGRTTVVGTPTSGVTGTGGRGPEASGKVVLEGSAGGRWEVGVGALGGGLIGLLAVLL